MQFASAPTPSRPGAAVVGRAALAGAPTRTRPGAVFALAPTRTRSGAVVALAPTRTRPGAAVALVLLAGIAVAPACDDLCMTPDAPDAPRAWSTGADAPHPIGDAGAAALGTNVVVVSGTEVDVYDTLADAWSVLPAAPVALTEANVGAVAGTLYAMGGLAEGGAWRLAPGAAAWTPIAMVPAGLERGGAGVVVAAPHVYLFGGETAAGGAAVASCLDYDLTTDTWTQLPDLPAARAHPAAMRRADNGTRIVAGGFAAGGTATADVWELPVGADAWVAKASLPSARGGCVYGAIGDALVCAGGETTGAVADVAEYATVSDAWTSLTPMPAPRARAAGVAIGTSLYVVGGVADAQAAPTSTLYRFDALVPQRDR